MHPVNPYVYLRNGPSPSMDSTLPAPAAEERQRKSPPRPHSDFAVKDDTCTPDICPENYSQDRLRTKVWETDTEHAVSPGRGMHSPRSGPVPSNVFSFLQTHLLTRMPVTEQNGRQKDKQQLPQRIPKNETPARPEIPLLQRAQQTQRQTQHHKQEKSKGASHTPRN